MHSLFYFQNVKKAYGFTLIELIVTFSIMSILSVVGIVTYQSYNQNKTLDLAASQVQSVLELAKSRSGSQVKPSVSACVSPRPLYGYRVTVTSTSSYTLSVVCGDTGQYVQQVGSTYTLPSSITFSGSFPQTVTFKVLSSETEGVSQITLSGYSQTRTISISSIGVIKT